MTIFERINIIAAIIAALSFSSVVAKFITKRYRKKSCLFFEKVDIVLMKIHKPAAIILIVSGTLHGTLSIINFYDFGIIPNILGTIGLLSCIASTAIFYVKKRLKIPKLWIFHHRFYAAVALVALIGHIVASI